MKDFKILKILDLIRFLFNKMGIDYPIMRQILLLKLTMDDRRVPTLYNQSGNKQKKESKNGYIKSLWFYVLFSLILIPFVGFGDNFIFQMGITYALIIFFIMTSMIADFSSVLLDVKDRSILFSKPITLKTLNAAKFLHILIYLSYLTIALTAIPLIVAMFTQGFLFIIISVGVLVFINLFIVVITAFIYFFILRFFDGEKLKDIINYVQIGLSIVLMVGYQFISRSFELVNVNIVLNLEWWSIFLIPLWFAAPYELFLNGNQSTTMIIFTILAIVIPIVFIWIYIKLIPTFERNLQKLLSTSKSQKVKKQLIKNFLLKLICRTKEEQAFYHFASLMIKQERDYKLKVYPSLGFALVVPFIFMFNIGRLGDFDPTVSMAYLNVYFSMLMIPTAVFMLEYSGKYKGAWIYQVVPIKDYTNLKKGSLKAFLIDLYLPLYLILSTIFCFIFGIRIFLDLIAVFVASCLYIVLCYVIGGNSIPFTMSSNEISNNQSWKIFVLMIPVALLAGLHYVIVSYVVYGKVLLILILLFVNWFIWKRVFSVRERNS